VSPLSSFDFVLHLDPDQLFRHHQSLVPPPTLAAAITGVSSDEGQQTIQLAFDPATAFVREMQRLHGDAAVLFHDECGGAVIGGLLNPSLDREREFRVTLGFSSEPVTVKGSKEGGEGKGKRKKVRLNRLAVVEGMKRASRGLVVSTSMR
jgi:U3 small nucleolar RNA-associated protein 22